MNIAGKIHQLRDGAKLSQQELAEKIHVSQQTISAWENNQREPDIQTAKNICDLFGISPDEFVE